MGHYRFALLGKDIEYSKSPDIFEAILNQTNKTGQFDLLSVQPEELRSTFDDLGASGVNGVCVTVPYKQTIIPMLDEIDPSARSIEAVNSIAFEEGKTVGYNTDSPGFSFALKGGATTTDLETVLVVGNGGSARAVIAALHTEFGLQSIWVAVRSKSAGGQLVDSLARSLPGLSLHLIDVNEPILPGKRISVAINCTPVGGPNEPEAAWLIRNLDLERLSLYCDLNYNRGNPLLEAARNNGVPSLDGSAMLVAQAVKSFELWTGTAVDFEPIYSSVFPERRYQAKGKD